MIEQQGACVSPGGSLARAIVLAMGIGAVLCQVSIDGASAWQRCMVTDPTGTAYVAYETNVEGWVYREFISCC